MPRKRKKKKRKRKKKRVNLRQREERYVIEQKLVLDSTDPLPSRIRALDVNVYISVDGVLVDEEGEAYLFSIDRGLVRFRDQDGKRIYTIMKLVRITKWREKDKKKYLEDVEIVFDKPVSLREALQVVASI